MAALRNQSRPVERYIGVDASSTDGSLEVLKANLPSNAALLVADEGSLGLSVDVAVSQLPEARADRDEWLWIIHDDSMPAPDALEHLTGAVEASESVSIAGCKLLDIDNPRHLVEVGLSVDRKAQRLTLIDTDEVDQGQYDGRSDYFAVSSAGMFIRREVFEYLGGFDQAIPGRGDDVDLCWRNRLAGYRVVVVPEAKMYHQVEVVEALAGPREAKRSEVFQRLKFASPLGLPFLWVGILLGGIGHFLTALLAKDPGHGFSYLGSTLRGLFSTVKLGASRRNVRDIRNVPRRQVRKLMASGSQVREYRRNLDTGREDSRVFGDGSGSDGAVEPSGDNFSDFVRIARPPRTTAVFSLLLALIISTGVSMVAWRSLFGASALSGGAARPFSTTMTEIGANALSWWQSVSTGLSAPADNTDSLFWIYSALSFNHANDAAVYMFYAAMPLAALSAWWGIGVVSRSRAVRFIAALVCAFSPSLVSSLATGRVGSVLVHIMAPLLFLAVLRAMGTSVPVEGKLPPTAVQANRTAWTASACAALILWIVSAGSMAFFLLAVLAIYLLAAFSPLRAKTLWWVPLPAVVWNLPLLIAALSNPRLLFTEPGAATAFNPAPLWQMALGFPEEFDAAAAPLGFGFLPQGPWALVAALLVGAPIVLLALAGAIGASASTDGSMRRNSRRLVWAAALSLAGGWAVGFIPVGLDSHTTVSAYTGPFVSFAMFALIAAAANACAALRHEQLPRTVRRPASRGLLAVMAGLSAVVIIASGAIGLAAQLNSENPEGKLAVLAAPLQVHPSNQRTIPATAADAGRSEIHERTLVLTPRASGEVDSRIVAGNGETVDTLSRYSQVAQLTGPLLDPKRNDSAAAENVQRQVVAMLLSESGLDAREQLRDLGIGYVVLNVGGEAVSSTVRVLDAATGLASVGQTDSGWLWRVDYQSTEANQGAGFARLVNADGSVTVLESSRAAIQDVEIPAADSPRTLVLATAADPKLRAYLGSESLRSVGYPVDSKNQWAQAYEVPASGGTLSLVHREPMAMPMLVISSVLLLVTVLLAIPVPSSRRFANYRNDSYKVREEQHGAQPVADGEAVLAAAEPVTGMVAQTDHPLSRREARERASALRENLEPKGSDRFTDDEPGQEKN
ncbi:integral membrane regulatory protein [Glutamicibacter uratoxydans]|uniref:Integral membrane regulatory protein n=1 Tax=Glutamicibacter uratoxydans TaxID=43667 RepID=A0A4Y4DTT7_GLUUR|nr:integral membrane regulatory protein [Glutamicibacter uratoxydans]